MSSRLVLCLRVEGESLHVRAEEDVEGLTGLAVDLVVGGDVELVEEGLIGRSPQRIVDAQVQRVAVAGEGQAVVQVCFGAVVLDVSRVDLCFQEPQAASDAVLFSLEQVNGHGAGVVGLQQLGPFLGQVVAFGLVGLALPSCYVVELVEMIADEVAEGIDDVRRDLDGAVVVLDGGFDVGNVHGFALAVGALGVSA